MSVPSKVEPKLLDIVCDNVASTLQSRLSWLDNAYGRCEKYFDAKEVGSDNVFPVVYKEGRDGLDYQLLLPDEGLGNFMFIDVEQNQEIPENNIGSVSIECNIAIIVWFDYRKVYPSDWQNRTIENVKFDVLEAISAGFGGNGRIYPYEVAESTREIYSTFSTRAIDAYTDREGMREALLRPFGGFRINCRLKFSQGCL